MMDDDTIIINTPHCAGTRTIEIRSKTDLPKVRGGMVAVFTEAMENVWLASSSSSSTNTVGGGVIRLMVTNGNYTFQGTIHVDQIKGERWEEKGATTMQHKISVITSYLLDEKANPNINVTYEFEPGPTPCNIRLEISRITDAGITARACSSVLKQVFADNNNDDNNSNTVGSLLFCQELATALQQKQHEFNQLEESLEKVQNDVDIWRDTAIKHEQAFQKRSDELLGNFLVLYRATHERLRLAEQRLLRSSTTVEPAIVATNNVMPAKSGRTTRTSKRNNNPHPVDLLTVPDDNDVELYDAETVDRLAATGPNQPHNVVKSDPLTVAGEGRKRPYHQDLNLVEADDTKQAERQRKGKSKPSNESSRQPTRRKIRKTTTTTNNNESSESSDQAIPNESNHNSEKTHDSVSKGNNDTVLEKESGNVPIKVDVDDDAEYDKQWLRENLKTSRRPPTQDFGEPTPVQGVSANVKPTAESGINTDMDASDEATQAMLEYIREMRMKRAGKSG